MDRKRSSTELEKESTETKQVKKLPKLGDYRMRAHINIFSDTPFP